MPACFVPFCGSGYGNKANKSCEIRPAVFNFPKSAKARRIWLNACRRDKLHFAPEDLLQRVAYETLPDGTIRKSSSKKMFVRLTNKEKVVPKIFPGFPEHQFKQKEAKPPKRRARHAVSVANKSKNFSGLNVALTPVDQIQNNVEDDDGLNVAPTPVDQIQNNVEDDRLQANIGLQLPLHHQEIQ
ncbi:hypothetical protein B566_EDAN016157 [Ephemera danica]|nr:hypothetical protein B566_EDAN016157 [Ephemera danica]